MKKFFPLYLAILAIVFFIGLIKKHEEHLDNSQSIYVQLKPVDPRSLIQGDYMVLDYELFWDKDSLNQDTKITDQPHINAYITLDKQGRVIQTSLIKPSIQLIRLNNPNNVIERLYPSTKTFLFAEGLSQCYEQAKYAEFKVNPEGKSILASLRAADLKDLNCEANKNWFKHS